MLRVWNCARVWSRCARPCGVGAVCPKVTPRCVMGAVCPKVTSRCGMTGPNETHKRDENIQMRYGCGVSESDPEMGQGLFTGCYAIGVSFGERFETLGVRVKLENFLELRVKL